MPGIGYPFWSCWPLSSHRPPRHYRLFPIPDHPLECVCQIPLLRTAHTKSMDEACETKWNQASSALEVPFLLVSFNSSGRCYACYPRGKVTISHTQRWTGPAATVTGLVGHPNRYKNPFTEFSEEAAVSAAFSPRHKGFIKGIPSERQKYIQGFDRWHILWNFFSEVSRLSFVFFFSREGHYFLILKFLHQLLGKI